MRPAWFALVMTIPYIAACAARAAIVLSLERSDYLLEPNESVIVPVSLQFTGSDAVDLLAHGGLLSAAFRVTQSGTPPASPVAPTLLAPNGNNFDDSTLTPLFLGPSPTQAGIWEFADITRSAGVLGQMAASNDRVIPLGLVTFTAGSSAGRTIFQAQAYDPTLQTTVTFDTPSLTLDQSIVPTTTTFTVVPEPRAGISMLIVGCVLMRRRDKAIISQ